MNQHKHSPSPWIQTEYGPKGTEYIASVRTSGETVDIFAPCVPHKEYVWSHQEWDGNRDLILAAPRMFETLLELAVILDESNETQRTMYDLVYGALKEAGWEAPATTSNACLFCGAPRA